MDWILLGSTVCGAITAMGAVTVAWMKLYLPYRLKIEVLRAKGRAADLVEIRRLLTAALEEKKHLEAEWIKLSIANAALQERDRARDEREGEEVKP